MRFKSNKRENKAKKFLIFLLVLLIIGGGIFIFFSPMFEKNSPKMSLNNEIYWNLKSPLRVNFSDDNAIKDYEIYYSDEKNDEIKLDTRVVKNDGKGSIDLDIFTPKAFENYAPKSAVLNIEVTDTSKWNFFMGNKLKKEVKIKVDKVAPVAIVLSNTYLIKQGGSAVVVSEVKDDNLKDMYIAFYGEDSEERFELFPFYKDGFYVSIIAWPMDIEKFKRVDLVAIDEANNKTITKVPLYIKYRKSKLDKMKISDNFIQRVSKIVLEKSSKEIPSNSEDIFIKENRELRAENMATIKEVVRKNMNKELKKKFDLKVFKKLRASLTFASYGEKRHYYYKGKKIDEAWHLGIDWASVKKAKIFVSNAGKVLYNSYLGIYGDAMIVDHNFGVSSLYAHTSRSNVKLNQEVRAGDYIANTGSSGAVFGDHLHFGILVQGIEVDPSEWLSKFWIRENVVKIIKKGLKTVKVK